MRKINKQQTPGSLTLFKQKSPNAMYGNLSPKLRQDIREACTAEQFYLCAYCCKQITGKNTDTLNEHIEPQDLAPNRTLDLITSLLVVLPEISVILPIKINVCH